MNEMKLGKIQAVKLGEGGYQDAMFGFSFTLGGDGWGVMDFWGTWANRSEGAKWSLEDQSRNFLEAFDKMRHLLVAAKKSDMNKLIGVPVEIVFVDGLLKSWRILTEVL